MFSPKFLISYPLHLTSFIRRKISREISHFVCQCTVLYQSHIFGFYFKARLLAHATKAGKSTNDLLKNGSFSPQPRRVNTGKSTNDLLKNGSYSPQPKRVNSAKSSNDLLKYGSFSPQPKRVNKTAIASEVVKVQSPNQRRPPSFTSRGQYPNQQLTFIIIRMEQKSLAKVLNLHENFLYVVTFFPNTLYSLRNFDVCTNIPSPYQNYPAHK